MAPYMEAKTLAKDLYVYMATGQWKNANMGQPIKREFKDYHSSISVKQGNKPMIIFSMVSRLPPPFGTRD
jgi:hypothetical protein